MAIFLKTTSPAEIINAIQQLVNGGVPMSSDVGRKVIASFQPPKKNNETKNLTAREKQVLELLSKGLLYKEIAAQLSIS